MPAKVVYSDENEKPDGSRYEMVAWQVPASEDFPTGLKFQNEVTEIYDQRTD